MKAPRLIENASYAPDQLNAIRKAFDHAWARIAPSVSQRPEAIEAARLKLAGVVLGLAKQGNVDPQQLADTAIQLMCAAPQKLRP